jgi:hypothetical protein
LLRKLFEASNNPICEKINPQIWRRGSLPVEPPVERLLHLLFDRDASAADRHHCQRDEGEDLHTVVRISGV